MKISSFCIILVLPVLLLSSCKKDKQREAAYLTGKLYTDNFDEQYGDILVTAAGGDIKASTSTEPDGTYHLSGLTAGTYNLTFEKEGYLTGRRKGIMLVGGDEEVDIGADMLIKDSEVPPVNATLDIIPYPDFSGMPGFTNDLWQLRVHLDPAYQDYYSLVFISEDNSVAWNRYEKVLFPNETLDKPEFKKGDHFYARVYLSSRFISRTDALNYPDPGTGAILYYGVYPDSESEIIEFTLN